MKKITLIEGDGIGPEIMKAVRDIISATGCQVEWEICQAGATVFKQGLSTGIPKETIESIKRTKVVLKGPLETPIGYGEKSANVTLRNLFNTYANIRPIKTIPGILTPFSGRNLDFVVVRENLEDLYAGIEYQSSNTVSEGLKIISRLGCEKIICLAFEIARAEGRKSVHCATKANILKLTEGMMKRTFEDVAREYPDISAKHIIVDNCAHQLVIHPEQFEVIVTTNLQGDILSDLASGLVGGLGVAAGANIGDKVAIFEAVHGAAPDIAGQNIANPTALLFSTIHMLRYINENKPATKIEHALLETLSHDQYFTVDLDKSSKITTSDFAKRIIHHLENNSSILPERASLPLKHPKINILPPSEKSLVGIDVFLNGNFNPQELGQHIETLCQNLPFKLKMISNRGLQVYPVLDASTIDYIDSWRCRFICNHSSKHSQEIHLLLEIIENDYDWYHIEKLYTFGKNPGYSKAQGED